ncbi:uncharacterized protein BKA78DRAFT_80301 [Phyllosticta capitalensis]|uniref:uncharacterized protein n=1 Tax=Phyllosticta capitalensis TaxID=121624 RepID=UPI0031326B50
MDGWMDGSSAIYVNEANGKMQARYLCNEPLSLMLFPFLGYPQRASCLPLLQFANSMLSQPGSSSPSSISVRLSLSLSSFAFEAQASFWMVGRKSKGGRRRGSGCVSPVGRPPQNQQTIVLDKSPPPLAMSTCSSNGHGIPFSCYSMFLLLPLSSEPSLCPSLSIVRALVP